MLSCGTETTFAIVWWRMQYSKVFCFSKQLYLSFKRLPQLTAEFKRIGIWKPVTQPKKKKDGEEDSRYKQSDLLGKQLWVMLKEFDLATVIRKPDRLKKTQAIWKSFYNISK